MTTGQSGDESTGADGDWPTFELTCTYNPNCLAGHLELAPDEVVVFDPAEGGGVADRWIAADRDAHEPLEDCR